MWYRFETLVDGVLRPSSVEHGFLAAALLEQAAAERAAISASPDAAVLSTGLRMARAAALRFADALAPGGRSEAGTVPPQDAERLRELVRAVEQLPNGTPAALPTTRRKYWPIIPECLGVHALDLDELAVLTDEALRSLPPLAERVVVVGVRSAGSVLAPMVAVRLERRHAVSYLTVRPGDGPADQAAQWVRRQLALTADPADAASWLIVDDPPTSGRTVRAVSEAVHALTGVAPQVLSIGHRDAALRRYRELAVALADSPDPLRRRKPPSQIPRTAVRDGDEVLVPFGDPTLGRLEAATLRRVFPALEPAESGAFIRVRWLGAPSRRDLAGGDFEALGRSLGRWYAQYQVDPVAPAVWTALVGRRLSGADPQTPAVMSLAAESADRLLRVGYGREWWNYRWPRRHDPVVVPGPAGHWSSVIDVSEHVGTALVELQVPPGEWPRVLAGYREVTRHQISTASLGYGILLYADSVRSALARGRDTGTAEWRGDRERALDTAAKALAASGMPLGRP